MKKKGKLYSDDFKWRVVREVAKGTLTKEEARKHYGIAGKSTLLEWMREASGQDSNGEIPDKKQQELLRLHQELEQKNLQMNYFQLKSEALEEMIAIAEKNYGIAIRKKRGAKRSKK